MAWTTFGEFEKTPIELSTDKEFHINEDGRGRRLSGSEIGVILKDCIESIAGRDKYSKDVLGKVPCLKVISRVGVGIEEIELQVTEALG